MKKLLLFLFLLPVVFLSSATKPNVKNVDPRKENKILEIVYNTIKSRHYISKNIDDDFSKKLFKTYLDSLDRSKLFLLQSDIVEFKKFETKLDDQLKNNDLTFFFMTYDRIMLRMRQGKEMYANLLKNKLDLSKNGISEFNDVFKYNSTNDKEYSKNKSDQLRRWDNFLKSSLIKLLKKTLTENKDGLMNDQLFKENLNSESSMLHTKLESTFINFDNMSREILFEYYINSIIVQFDKHSKYYNPANRDKYLLNQTGKLEGAGITVNLVDDFIKIKRLAVGGPAMKTNKFEIEDVILKVGQGNEEPTSVIGYTIFDVVKLLKGKSGTTVKVTIKKPNGTIEVIPIKRGIVSTNDSHIKSCLVTKNKVKYAIISFPRFYVDFDDDMVRNVVDDFEKELQILKESEVEGIIIDLRNNGGGSVEAAVKILGNFISKNPIVQLKNKESQINILETQNATLNWDKSVVLVVNSETASAAEIFAAAFKEYNVGVVIGEQTYGKGTVQDFLDLNSFNSKKIENVDFGSLKITTNAFYKLNGKSIQKTGILPDVVFSKVKKQRESDISGALSPEEIKSVNIKSNNVVDYFNKIIYNSQARLLSDKNFKLSTIIENEKIDFDNIKTLNIQEFKTQIDELIVKRDNSKNTAYKNNLEFTSTLHDIKMLKKKEYLLQKRKDWHEQLTKDFQIEEGLNILEDMYILKN